MADTAPHNLTDILQTVIEKTDGETATLGDILNALGKRSFGPLWTILGLLIVAPTGMVPGIPMVFGALIALIAVEILRGANHVWVPDRLERIEVSRDRLKEGADKGSRWINWVDRLLSSRLHWAFNRATVTAAALLCILHALFMVPLEIVPGGVVLPGTAVMLFGLALTASDGLFMLAGLIMSALAIGGSAYFLIAVM